MKEEQDNESDSSCSCSSEECDCESTSTCSSEDCDCKTDVCRKRLKIIICLIILLAVVGILAYKVVFASDIQTGGCCPSSNCEPANCK